MRSVTVKRNDSCFAGTWNRIEMNESDPSVNSEAAAAVSTRTVCPDTGRLWVQSLPAGLSALKAGILGFKPSNGSWVHQCLQLTAPPQEGSNGENKVKSKEIQFVSKANVHKQHHLKCRETSEHKTPNNSVQL